MPKEKILLKHPSLCYQIFDERIINFDNVFVVFEKCSTSATLPLSYLKKTETATLIEEDQ